MLVFAVISEKAPHRSTPMVPRGPTPGGLNEKPEIQRCLLSESVYSLTRIQSRRKKTVLDIPAFSVIAQD
jgi:hypothetical protein